MRNIRLDLEYDGTNYSGWQKQAVRPPAIKGESRPGEGPVPLPTGSMPSSKGKIEVITIQETIEEAITHLTGEHSALICAGRTDAGVHALGQVASFKTPSGLHEETIKRALNALLPRDIRVIEASEVSESFHARRSASGKRYVYFIHQGGGVPVFLRRFLWSIPYELDLASMDEAGRFFLGEHDFSSMRGSGCGAKNPVREIRSLTINETDAMDFMQWSFKGRLIRIAVEADAFLRHMVRNIVGTLVEAGRGRIRPEAIIALIASKDRRLAGPTAPPMGLFLERVDYPSFSTASISSFLS